MIPDLVHLGNPMPAGGIGDAVIWTAVAREIKKVKPKCKIYLHSHSPLDMFANNPNFDSITPDNNPVHLPGTGGHHIQMKCKSFGITNPELKGEFFLTPKELEIGQAYIQLLSPDKPIILFAKNSKSKLRDWQLNYWEEIVDMLNARYAVFQIDESIGYYGKGSFGEHVLNDSRYGMPFLYDTVKNARQELRNIPIRHLIILASVAKGYLGTNTGAMHIVTAFSYDNIIFMNSHEGGEEGWIYPQNTHFWEYHTLEQVKEIVASKWLSEHN